MYLQFFDNLNIKLPEFPSPQLMEERKTKITPSKQDKKTTTSAASKLK